MMDTGLVSGIKKQLVGSIGYLWIDWDSRRIEIGYWLGSNFEGKGIMTKSCKAIIKHAFNDLHLAKVKKGLLETTRCFTINTLTG